MSANETEDVRGMLARKLMHLSRKHFQRADELLERIDLGSGQVPVLMELHHHGELNQRELAEHMNVTAATVSGTLKRMERAGMVCREPDSKDARMSRVRLTERGSSRREEAKSILDQVGQRMTEGLSDEECQVLDGLLERMLRNMSCHVPQYNEEREGGKP